MLKKKIISILIQLFTALIIISFLFSISAVFAGALLYLLIFSGSIFIMAIIIWLFLILKEHPF